MITNLIIPIIVSIFNSIMEFIPSASISEIPIIGPTVADTLLFAIRAWNSAMETVPYLKVNWEVFLYVILPFEATLLVINFLLGSRKLGRD